MAVGDDATSAGIALVPGTGKASDLDYYINLLADEVARRTMATLSIARGGTGATTKEGALANLGVPAISAPGIATANGVAVFGPNKRLQVQDPELPSDAATKYWTDNTILYHRNQLQQNIDGVAGTANAAKSTADDASGKANDAKAGRLSSDAYNRVIGGNRRATWTGENGDLGYAASSQRYKKFIRPEDVSDEQILTLSLVSYQWKVAVIDSDHREMGLIAERLVEAGLGWACFWNADGTVEGINYEMVGIALLPAVQRLITRVSRIEESL